MTAPPGRWAERARVVAEEVLLPAAAAVERGERDVTDHLDLFAREGFYTAVAPAEAGGEALDPAVTRQVVEHLAGGCLSTAFTWIQHHRAVRDTATTGNQALRADWLDALAHGRRHAAVALGALMPGPVRLRAEPAGDGWTFSGEAPWVTGWRHVDVVDVVARTHDDRLVWALLDATAAPTLEVGRRPLVAVEATDTVHLAFDAHPVPAARVLRVEPASAWTDTAASLRQNGSLALGVTGRCCALLGPGPFDDELGRVRGELDAATAADDVEAVLQGRAAASALAMRAATALVVSTGSRAAVRHGHAERLVREATFLLVFGSRPAIKAALLDQLGARR